MPVEVLKCSTEIQPFFNELSMPKGINGNEEFISKYGDDLFSQKIHLIKEVLRRMQDLHDTINSGRFFLCAAQRSSFSEYYKEPTPKWANDWVRAQFIVSSIQSYNSAFDLYLQVNWLFFELFKSVPSIPHEITTKSLKTILKSCSINKITTLSNKSIIGDCIYSAIKNFSELPCRKKIHSLCNAIKHRQRIDFKELSAGKHQIYIDFNEYNSHDTLLIESIYNLISILKDYHKAIVELCNISTPYWSYNTNP